MMTSVALMTAMAGRPFFNFRRLADDVLMSEDHHGHREPRTELLRSGGGLFTPSTFATGYRYAQMGYTAAFEPAMLPSNARNTHLELADVPMVDKGCYALLDEGIDIVDDTSEEAASRRVRVDYREKLVKRKRPDVFSEKLTLANDPKNQAENRMIVDLLRNDISLISEVGTLDVPELFRIESFATVHHLVSTVLGELRPGMTAVDLLAACFPGGSITGAPKIRAMEIIAGLEPTRRGPYCGSIGYIGFDGSMDTSIVIRTYAMRNGQVTFQAGGGIVADSEPAAEYAETLAKAQALIAALSP